MNISASNRIEWVDLSKGIAIVLVLIGHCLFVPPTHDGSLAMNFIASFHMPVFFILSGWFFSGRLNVRKVFLRLIVPYFFFIGIGACAFALCGQLRCDWGWRACVLSVFNCCPYYNGTLWFCGALASVQLLLPVVLKFGRYWWSVLPFLVFAAIAVQHGPDWIKTDIPFRPSQIPMSLFFFASGYLLRGGGAMF